jgi:glutathione S-transferase
VTVPTLWDKKTKRIVNNESSEIIRMLSSEFNGITGNTTNYYPPPLRADIDRLNERIYHNANNGVYRCGFAKSQAAYEEAYDGLFATLDELEERLSRRRYLVGHQLTEADWRLFPTLVRFDVAYFSLFKCNRNRIADYPNLSKLHARTLSGGRPCHGTFWLFRLAQALCCSLYLRSLGTTSLRVPPRRPIVGPDAGGRRGRIGADRKRALVASGCSSRNAQRSRARGTRGDRLAQNGTARSGALSKPNARDHLTQLPPPFKGYFHLETPAKLLKSLERIAPFFFQMRVEIIG